MHEKKRKMNNEEKRIALSHISHILSNAEIPHVYNVMGETITLRNVDMTDVLLELHFYQDEYITDILNEKFKLEQLVNILKCCNNCKYHHVSGCDYEDKKECNWQTKTKWELCE